MKFAFTPAPASDVARGLLAYVRVDVGAWVFDGLTVRRTMRGELVLGWPERSDGAGRKHPYVRPASREIRAAVECAALDAFRVS